MKRQKVQNQGIRDKVDAMLEAQRARAQRFEVAMLQTVTLFEKQEKLSEQAELQDFYGLAIERLKVFSTFEALFKQSLALGNNEGQKELLSRVSLEQSTFDDNEMELMGVLPRHHAEDYIDVIDMSDELCVKSQSSSLTQIIPQVFKVRVLLVC